MTFSIYLEDFVENIFMYIDKIQDGSDSHNVEFNCTSKEECAKKIAEKLIPFISIHLKEVNDEDI